MAIAFDATPSGTITLDDTALIFAHTPKRLDTRCRAMLG
jgi:hypothetical protein